MDTVLHVDGDILLYAMGFAFEDDPIDECKRATSNLLKARASSAEADYVIVHLSGKDNFRIEEATIQEYKANRKDNVKPTHYEELKEWLRTGKWLCVEEDGMEADDTLGICCTADDGNKNILMSKDKDLKMIPGHHLDWKTGELYEIDEETADNAFIIQLLTGDSTDNIPGLYKLTGKKATKKLKDRVLAPDTFKEKCLEVLDVYVESTLENDSVLNYRDILSDTKLAVREIGNLLWIKQTKWDKWEDKYAKT